MIYDGKEYVEIAKDDANAGDLVHITALDDNACDIHEFITWIDYEDDIHFDNNLPDGSYFVYIGDTFKTYRYVKDVKEGDYMVITGNNNGHEFEIGETVEVLNPYDGDDDFHAVGAAGNWYVKYADARFATADEIATLNKPQLTFDRGDHVKILSDIAEGHADFSIDSVVTAQFRTDDGVMVQNLKGDVRKVIADEFLRKATPDEAIAAISARYGHGERTLKTQIDDFFDGMSALLVAKNENYGDSFSKQYDKYGMQGVEMRLNDKFMRLEQLIAGQPDKVGESVEDTLKDIIGYSTLALLKINENRTELSA